MSIATANATGSGVILSKDGYILTNNHVAATASGQGVEITFSDGSTAKATLVGTDPKTDLAVYKAENVSNCAPPPSATAARCRSVTRSWRSAPRWGLTVR